MSRGVLLRLVALGLTVLAGFGYMLFGVVGVRAGAQPYKLTVMLPSAGGIYSEADVTYRGVTVGRVRALHLERAGVAAVLAINPGVRIPADSTASVRELTAAGEQYLDLVPGRPGGAYLPHGGVIAVDHTSVPVSIDATLIDFGQLLSSINPADLQKVNKELAAGFGGAGPQFHALVAETTNLLDALRASENATVSLQVGGKAVLRTALATNQELQRFSSSLRKLTGAVATDDPDLRQLLTHGASAVAGLHQVLSADSGNIETFIASLATITKTAYARNPAIQALFQALPVFATNLAGVAGNGTINTELLFNTADTVCPYLPAAELPSPSEKTNTVNLGLNCSLSAPDLLQRGAAHAPGS